MVRETELHASQIKIITQNDAKYLIILVAHFKLKINLEMKSSLINEKLTKHELYSSNEMNADY